jgi:rfaE bifunctional protein nucleotidyltransferase chain/domain
MENKIQSFSGIRKISKKLKNENRKIVFTNGCFDILHFGHVNYLAAAKRLGDILIVGLNSDASVRRLKGKSRPVNCARDRARVLAALENVDFVVIFGEDTPLKLIKAIVPSVLVKGGDWNESNIVGADFVKSRGGKVLPLSFIKGYSTTKIIDKFKKCGK